MHTNYCNKKRFNHKKKNEGGKNNLQAQSSSWPLESFNLTWINWVSVDNSQEVLAEHY